AISPCTSEPTGHYCCPPNFVCGCSSVVEHLLAKEDVASSSLAPRSSPAGGCAEGFLSLGKGCHLRDFQRFALKVESSWQVHRISEQKTNMKITFFKFKLFSYFCAILLACTAHGQDPTVSPDPATSAIMPAASVP